MELDLTRHRWILPLLLSVCLLAALIQIGRACTPESGALLTWADWRVLQGRQAYRLQLQALQRQAEALVELVNAPPDPVLAQLAADQTARQTREGHPALTFQRQLLDSAAQAVRDWAVGAGERAAARQALQAALQSLNAAGQGLP
jgi:hypothetical protein